MCIRDRFQTHLADIVAAKPVIEHPEAESVWHLNVVQVPDRDRVIEGMQAKGVDVRIHYPQTCHSHPSLSDQPSLPVVEASTPRLLSLPMYPTIGEQEIDLACETLKSVLAELGHGG